MKRIMMTTAVAMMLASPVLADMNSGKFMNSATSMEILGSEFIGARVYVIESDLSDDYRYEAGAEDEWDDVGEINEIVLDRDGSLKAAIIGVGGFIGIGEKDVAIKMDKLRFVQDGNGYDDYFVVFTSSLAELEGAPEWEDPEERMTVDQRESRIDIVPASRRVQGLDNIERDRYVRVATDDLVRDKLIGARVYGIGDEDVGEVSDVVGDASSANAKAIIDVGGFLGMGEKPVAVSMADLRVMRGEDRDDFVVYIDATEDRLEAMPEYEKM